MCPILGSEINGVSYALVINYSGGGGNLGMLI